MANWLDAEIIENRQWNTRLFSLRIRLPETQPRIDFQAGQFVRVALDIDGERIARPYSLVNSPADPLLEIFFNIVPEGPLSPRLASLQAGERIFVSQNANGFLTLNELPACRHLWMLATGTGIGPFLSILKTGEVFARMEKTVLVYSVRDGSELAYRELIGEIESQQPERFRFVPCVTREDITGALPRRIPAAIEDGSLEQAAGIEICKEHSHVMMCGNSAMIADVSEILKARGLKKHLRREPGQIMVEKYH